MNSIVISRFLLAFAWIYHGLVPKLLHVAPLEYQMMSKLGFNFETTVTLTQIAGISEIIFGLVIWWQYQNKAIIALNVFALLGLLIVAGLLRPNLIVEAFNPVTTNLTLIGLSLILWQNCNQNKRQHPKQI